MPRPSSSSTQDGNAGSGGGGGSDDGGGGDDGDDDGGGQRNSSSFSFLEFCSAPDLRAAQFLLTSGAHARKLRWGEVDLRFGLDSREEIGRVARARNYFGVDTLLFTLEIGSLSGVWDRKVT